MHAAVLGALRRTYPAVWVIIMSTVTGTSFCTKIGAPSSSNPVNLLSSLNSGTHWLASSNKPILPCSTSCSAAITTINLLADHRSCTSSAVIFRAEASSSSEEGGSGRCVYPLAFR